MKVVLLKDYRPLDTKDGPRPEVKAGETTDLPDDEAKAIIDLGIAQSPEDAAKAPNELAAINLLTGLGYTISAPKPEKVKNA